MLKFLRFLIIASIIFSLGCKEEKQPILKVFPLKKYNQTLTHWIKPEETNYDIPFVRSDIQQQKMAVLFKHYFGEYSPWHPHHVEKILKEPQPNDLKTTEAEIIESFNNHNKTSKELGYGENFRVHSPAWIKTIADNIPLDQFNHLTYQAQQRAIAIDNLLARALPTYNPSFYRHTLPGQGYPFDNLQVTAIWVGTPLYILGETRDHAWSLVMSPDVIAWVPSSLIAKVTPAFIKKWTQAAEKKLVAITQTQTSIVDTQHAFRFLTYVGTFFPGVEEVKHFRILIPVINDEHQVVIRHAFIPKEQAASMPLLATPRHLSRIIQTLLGRPYGWGNAYFYNDCSSELKNLFATFGIWLPRHSTEQAYAGNMTDLSSQTMKKRIHFLMEHGKPYSTLVYIDHHVFLFLGNHPNLNSQQKKLVPMTFQNMWGLSPRPTIRRAVIGQSVIFPLLEYYPEDRTLISQAAKKSFIVSFLDEPSNSIFKLDMIDLKDLMSP